MVLVPVRHLFWPKVAEKGPELSSYYFFFSGQFGQNVNILCWGFFFLFLTYKKYLNGRAELFLYFVEFFFSSNWPGNCQ